MNHSPSNFCDVVVIINNNNWYETDQEIKRELINMISYVIFKRGYYNWAMEVSYK